MQDQKIELPQLPLPPMTITHLMNACSELAGSLQVMTLLSMDGYAEDAIKILAQKADTLCKGAQDVFHRELERDRHYSNLDIINDLANEVDKLRNICKHAASTPYVEALNKVVAHQADLIQALEKRVVALEKIGKKIK